MIRDYIQKGDIKQTLENVCLIIHMNDERISQLEDDFIQICSFIGKNMEIVHTRRWYDIVDLTLKWVSNERVEIDETLVLCSKMCTICKQIFEHNTINLKQLRGQVISDLEFKLKQEYMRSFENILPIPTSQSYPVACNITMCFMKYYESVNDLSHDSKELTTLTNRLRLCIEYITRKDVFIETPNSKDYDCIWFLWNVIMQISQSPHIQTIYKMFVLDWKPTMKKKRLGLLWGSVYLLKPDDTGWSKTELDSFAKIKQVSSNLMYETRQKYPKPVSKRNNRQIQNVDVNALWEDFAPSPKLK